MPIGGKYPKINGNITQPKPNIMQLGNLAMKTPANIRGVTLIELMIVVVITAILLALAVPAFQDTIDKNRLKAATDTLQADLQFAKSEAIKRNKNIRVDFTGSGATWCYGMKEDAACDCTETVSTEVDFCEIDGIKKTVDNIGFPGVTIANSTPPDFFSFDHIRGTVNAGNVTFNSARQKETRVVISTMGRVRSCSPTDSKNVPGYSSC